MAQRGGWIEYDGIGREEKTSEDYRQCILRVLDAGLGDCLIPSHDWEWYDLAQPGEYTPRPFVYISGFAWPS